MRTLSKDILDLFLHIFHSWEDSFDEEDISNRDTLGLFLHFCCILEDNLGEMGSFHKDTVYLVQ